MNPDLGLWLPVTAESHIAFDVNGATEPEGAVWHVDLPRDPEMARRQLTQRAAGLNRFDANLTVAGRRLVEFRDRAERGAGAASFSVQALPAPEQALLGWLGEAESRAAVSYGLGEDIAAGWAQARDQLAAVVERAVDLVVYYARVETDVEGESLGRTTVGWTGSMDTAWRAELTPKEVSLHTGALALALQSRNAYLRAFALASRGAVMLAALPALLAAPGGALVALPAAWKFIQDVLAELEQAR